MSRPTSATIHLAALRHNLSVVRARAPASRVMAVVKADGYGHGLERVAHALAEADAFGVAALADAERLRAAGLSQRIVLLSGFDEPADLPVLRALGVDTVVHHPSQVAMLEALDPGPAIRCWLKIDTGMHRLGIAPEDAVLVAGRLRALKVVDPELIVMSHFSSSDEFGGATTSAQIAQFDQLASEIGGPRSLANSAAVLGWPQAHADWVRPGGALYGMSVVPGRTGSDFGLKAAMTLSTRLIAVNRVRAGQPIGYSGAFICPEDMLVGVAAIGYGDGYPRHVPSGTPVLLNGEGVPLIGRVSMDLMTLDLRSQPAVQVGDPVQLWGPQLPVEHIANIASTIAYELTCSITRRVQFRED